MIRCFLCGNSGCGELPSPTCPYQPAPWSKYVRGRNLARVGVGGLKTGKW
ncbi:hypothetical protein [Geoglobus acetivorans]